MEVLFDLYEALSRLHPAVIYSVMFALTYAENVFPPVPSDFALIVGGMLSGIGVVHLPVLVFVSVAGASAGFMTAYAAGRRLGPALLHPDKHRWVPKDLLALAEASVLRHGRGIVLANRFVPGVRVGIALAVGMSGVPAHSTAVLATTSALVWTVLLSGIGYVLGDNRAALLQALNALKEALIVLVAGLALLGLWYYVSGRKKRRLATHAHELPPPPDRPLPERPAR